MFTTENARISSQTLGDMLGVRPHSVRRDISYLGETGQTRAGYSVSLLRRRICDTLCLSRVRNTCVVGLEQLGCALARYMHDATTAFSLVAGFDSDVNRLEILHMPMPLYPSCDIAEIVPLKHIEIGILSVPAHHAQLQADRLIAAGIRGIINATPVVITTHDAPVVVQSIDLAGELTQLSGFLHCHPASAHTNPHTISSLHS